MTYLIDIDWVAAATAIQQDLALVTRNVRHFHSIPGLRQYAPAQR